MRPRSENGVCELKGGPVTRNNQTIKGVTMEVMGRVMSRQASCREITSEASELQASPWD